MEEARTNGGAHYHGRRPIPMEEARTNGDSPYQWRRPVPMEKAHTNGGGHNQWRRILVTHLYIVFDKKDPFQFYRRYMYLPL
jgi:hypothetical protein